MAYTSYSYSTRQFWISDYISPFEHIAQGYMDVWHEHGGTLESAPFQIFGNTILQNRNDHENDEEYIIDETYRSEKGYYIHFAHKRTLIQTGTDSYTYGLEAGVYLSASDKVENVIKTVANGQTHIGASLSDIENGNDEVILNFGFKIVNGHFLMSSSLLYAGNDTPKQILSEETVDRLGNIQYNAFHEWDGDLSTTEYPNEWGIFHSAGLNKFWLDYNGYGSNWDRLEPTSKRGYYKGLPTSSIPLRQFIRGDINYMRNIDVFDETNQKPMNAFLVNRVGTISYNGVEFAYPNIIFRASTDLQFTHIVTASWSDDNRPVVYRVLRYKQLGGNLNEYTVSVDGLKTYFQYRGITTNNPIVTRCTAKDNSTGSEQWNRWASGQTALYDGTFDTDIAVTMSTSVVYRYGFCVGSNCYVINNIEILNTWVNSQTYPQYIASQITCIFKMPFDTSMYPESVTSIQFETIDPTTGAKGTPVTFTHNMAQVGQNITFRDSFAPNTTEFQNKVNDGAAVDDGVYSIYVPGYGDVKPSRNAIIALASGGSIGVRFYISMLTGQMAIAIEQDGECLTSIQLPTIDLQISTIQQQVKIQNQQAALQSINTAVGSTASAIGAVATGNVAGAVGSVISGVTGIATQMAGNSLTLQSMALNARSTTINAGGGYSFAYTAARLRYSIPNRRVPIENLYSVIGFPVSLPMLETGGVSGACYWLSWNTALMNDKKEIIDDLIAQSQNGIIWNA